MIFNLTDQQTDQILNALATRPYMEVAPIIQELVQQVQAQKQPQVPGFAAALNGAAEAQQRSQ
jgi:hypothetical protein